MKRLVYLSMAMVILIGLLPAATVAQPPGEERGGSVSYDEWWVEEVTPGILPAGTAFDFCFFVGFISVEEYLDTFEADLPDSWTVNYVLDVPGNTGYPHFFGAIPGSNELYWISTGDRGAWEPGMYNFCANVTLPNCDGSPWNFDWRIWGDGGEGGEPHYLDGVSGPVECHPVGVHLFPSSQGGSACWGEQVTHTFDLLNLTGVDDSFSITADAQWPMSCPGSVYALDGETVPFQCTVDVPCGGSSDTATVTASGQGYSGSATATSFDTGWADQGTAPVATSGGAVVSWDGKLYLLGGTGSDFSVQIWDGSTWTLGAVLSGTDDAGDACLGLDADGNPVIDLPGGYQRSTFNRYNIATDTWTTVPFPAGFPSTGLAGVDVVSMLQHTGENVCYISGGRWQTGASNTLYAYHPDTLTLSDLGSFTYAPSGITWHFSWWVPWVEGGAICIAGGADHDLIPYADSQCYVLATGVMNAPNADLGPLPHTWALGGDAWRVHEGEYRIWGFGGLKLEGQIVPLQASFYAAPGQGFTFGPEPVHAVSSLEGDNWNGAVWAANGSDSSFVGTNLQEWLYPCPDCGGQNIQVTPESLYAQQCPDTQTEQTLQICNIGSGELTWSLSEGNPHWLESATPTGSEQQETHSASPAFAPYEAVAPPGTRAEASVPTVLWDQPAGEGPSAISSHWMDSEIGAWSADDFQNSERWTLTSITVQGEYAGDLHNAGMLYWCIYPDTGGVPPNWIPGADSGVCLRYAPSDPKVTIDDSNAPNVDVTVTIPPHGAVVPAYMDDLQAGHWWLIFYAEFWDTDEGFGWRSSDATGLVDALLLDPGSQYGGGATWTSWPPLGGPPALSFRLEGIASPVPWLSEDPTSGSLLGGQCANVAVTFDSTYPFYDSAPLYVDSNDPDQPRVQVDVGLDVLYQAHKVGFHWAPPNPMAGEELAFIGTALGFDTQFAWDFGDGATGTGNPALHTYATPGQYDVTLTVSAGTPCTVSVVKTVTVYPPLTCTEVFFDDFESGFNDWTLQGLWHGELESDVCGARVAPFPSPVHSAYFADLEYEQEWGYCLYNLLEAPYGSLELASDLDLSGVQIADLQFSSYAETECMGMDGCNWSLRNVEASTDGGLTWAPIGSLFTEWEWVDSWFGLSEYTGGPVRLRFFFDSLWPSGWDYFGWMVDNVRVRTCTLVGEPDIDVDPLSLSATVCPDGSDTQTLQVCNLGDLDLDWSASEDLEWLTVSPMAGTVVPGDCDSVQVEFFGPGSDPFDGVIAFTSNDPDEPLVEVAVSLTVLDPPHDAGFSWTPPEPSAGETITFQGWAQGSEPLTYEWDFGDGGTGLGPEATHAYAAPGDYLVTLTVSNDCNSVQVQHTVHVYAGPVLRIEPGSLSAEQCPDTVTSQQVQVCNDGDQPFDWSVLSAPSWASWLPASGTVDPGTCQTVDSTFDSTGLAPGTYGGYVDGTWWIDSFFDVYVELTVLDPPHDGGFSWAPPDPLVGETVTFQGWAEGSEPLDYAWDFGDGGGSNGVVVTHAYAAPGNYLVTLTVSNDCDWVQVQHTVTVAGMQTMHVASIKMGYRYDEPDIRRVFAAVKIVDENEGVVWDATVDGEWTLPNGRLRTQQRTTNYAGLAKFMWKVVPFGTYQLCVLDVTKSGLVYDPDQNLETCDSITVPLGGAWVPD